MIIDAFLVPTAINEDTYFSNSVVIMIDVLRASTTIVTALSNNAREIIITDTTEKAVKLYNTIDRQNAILAGERNGMKPDGFGAGNSPTEFTREKVENKIVILTTTNGTQIFTRAKESPCRIVASFVNLSAVCEYVLRRVESDPSMHSIILFAAGNKGRISYEDTLAAGAFVSHFHEQLSCKLTDAAHLAKSIYQMHKDNIKDFIRTTEHAKLLESLGFESDIEIASTIDLYPIIPYIEGNSIKILKATEVKNG